MVSVKEKAKRDFVRYEQKRRIQVNRPMIHRNYYVMSKPSPVGRLGINLKESPVFRLSGIRCLGGVNFAQGFMWNAGTSRFNAKGEVQVGNPHKSESTDVKNWGGTTRSSDEASVMEVE